MKLSVRLGLGFGLVLALLALVGLCALYTQERLSQLNRKLYDHPFVVKSAVQTIETLVREIQRQMPDLLQARGQAQINAVVARVNGLDGQAEAAYRLIDERFLGPRDWYLRALGIYKSWRQTCGQAQGLVRAGRVDDAAAIIQNEGRLQARLVVEALRDVRDFADKMAASIWAETQAARRQSLITMWALIAAAILAGIGFAIFITRSVSIPARVVARESKALANGDLKRLITYQSKDEIGQMAQNLRRLLSGVIGEGQSIKNGLRAPMWTADLDQTVTFLNPAAARIAQALTGLPLDRIEGRLKVAQALPDRKGLLGRMAGKSLEMDGQGTVEISFLVEGQEMILLESTSPLLDLDGNLMGVMGVGLDVTERRQAEKKLSESQERLSTLVEESFDGIFLQRGGIIVFTNQRLRQMLGYAEGELEGKDHWLIYHPDYQELTRERAQRRMRGEKVISAYEVKLLRKDGASFEAEVRAKPIMVMGEPGIQVWLRDISERKEAEERFRALVENSPLGTALIAPDGRYLYVNPKFVEMFGYDLAEVPNGRAWLRKAFPAAENRHQVAAAWVADIKAAKPGEVRPQTFEVTCRDGSQKIILFRPLTLADGRQLITYEDITERKRAEEELARREETLSGIFNAAQSGIILVDASGAITFANQQMAEMFGFQLDELIGSAYVDHTHGSQSDEAREKMLSLMRGEIDHVSHERLYHRKDGSTFWGYLTGRQLHHPDGSFWALVGVIQDISEHKQAERDRQEREAELAAIYENAPMIMMLVDSDRRVLRINGFGQKFAGVSEAEMLGLRGGDALRCLNALEDPEGCGFGQHCGQCAVRRTVLDTLETGRSHPLVEASLPLMVAGERKELTFLISTTRLSLGQGHRVLVSLLDISERKKAEEALRQSEALLNEVGRIAKIGGWEMDLTTRQARWTQGTYDIVEIEPGQPVPGPDEHVSYYLPEHQPLVKEAMRALIEDDQPLDFEAQARTAKGRLIWVRAVGQAVRQDGVCVKVFGTLQDITARKQAEEELCKSEEHFRFLFENMLNGFAYCQMLYEDGQPQDFIYLEVNRNFEKLTGLKDVVGKRVSEVIPGIRQTNPEVFEIYGRVALSGQPEWFETYVPALDMWFSISVYSPQREYFVAVFEVVTERKKAEERLKASEERFRSLAMLLPEIIFETDAQGRITFVNRAASERMGYTQEEMKRGLTATDMLAPADRSRAVENIKKVLAGQELELREYTAQAKDGSTFPCLVRSAPIMKDGAPVGLRGFVVDISDRKKVEEALRASEERFRGIVETANEGIWVVDGQYRTTFVNARMAEMLGYSMPEMLGRPASDFMVESELESHQAQMALRQRGEAGHYERLLRRKDGSQCWCLVAARPVFDQKGEFAGAFGMFTDISDRKRAEEEMQRSEAQVRAVLDTSPDMVFRFNRQRICTFFKPSPLFPTLLNDSAVGQDMAGFTPPEILDERMRLAGEVWRTGEPQEHTYSVMVNGERAFRWAVYVYWSPEEVLATVRDVTGRAKLESQLRQSQKMEAIGTLAGGIAHDFNNILGAMIGYTELALDEAGQDGPLSHELKQVLLAGQRAKNLVRQILSFSRTSEQEQAAVQIAPIVKEALKLLRPATPSNIEIKTDLADQEDHIMADPVQVHQIIMNLCTNAVQAMEQKGGVLEVALQSVELDQKEAARYVDLQPGRYQVLSVSDTGVGMDQGTLSRVFEPFFTTKEAERGTGLGLSVVHGIVHSHGGAITAYSEPGQGSTFRVYLPVIQGPAPEKAAENAPPAPGGQERILLVDDEQALVDLGRSFLERLGYRVTGTTSSRQALELFTARPQDFDLVLTDYTMPHLTGVALSQEMLKIRPDIPIIISTGFSHQLTEDKAKAIGIRRMVMKPVLGTRLAYLIREVLNGKS
ncbi:MAG: PAS domain S-box protein [Desulfarculus sp.]|nr:MAG: PAS domain S-box protein [Desulfarculus sp.]